MATTGSIRQQLEEEIAVAIAEARGGADAGRMARTLLHRDRGSTLLIGLTDDAGRAVYYDRLTWGVRFVPFDADGMDGLHSRRVETREHRGGVESFVREHDGEFAWVHPRVRWVLD